MNESSDIWNDAAKSLEFQQNISNATVCYERARKFGDESEETLFNLAVSYIRLYKFYNNDKYLAQAKTFLLSAREKNEQNPKIYHYLGLVYLALGEKEMAAEEFFYAQERELEESSELLLHFDLPIEIPSMYETIRGNVYELLPDPMLYKIFDLIRNFPLDKVLFESLKETYGERDTASLLALYLRSIYYKVFEDQSFASILGISTPQSKWESLLVFFVRGINANSIMLVKSALKEGKLDLKKLPAYTRLLVERYDREIFAYVYDKESFKALTLVPLKKLIAINNACIQTLEAKKSGIGVENIFESLAKLRLAHKKADSFILSESILAGFDERERVESKLLKKQYDQEFFILVHELFKRKRFELALLLAKKIGALYDEKEAIVHVKNILSQIALSEEEKFEILSEV